MNYVVVINGFDPARRENLGRSRAFLQANFPSLAAGLTVIFAPPGEPLAELGAGVFTERVLAVRLPRPEAEAALPALAERAGGAELLIFTGDFGREAAVRLAFRLRGTALTSAERAFRADGGLTAVKRVYSQHLAAAFALAGPPYCLALAPGLPAGELPEEGPAWLEEMELEDPAGPTAGEWSSVPEPQARSLAGARRLVVAGDGVGGRAGLEKLAELAELWGAELGVSRPVVMKGWAPAERLVGVSGTSVRPEVCLALGVSGAPALYAGLEKSGFIAAVNTDPRAPLVRGADAALTADWAPVAEELLTLAKNSQPAQAE